MTLPSSARLALVAVALALPLAACGGGRSDSTTAAQQTGTQQTEAQQTESGTTQPNVEPTGTEAAGPAQGGISVHSAALPIGLNPDDSSNDMCVGVNANGPLAELPDGVGIRVTGVTFDRPDLFTPGGRDCGGDNCANYTFRIDAKSCSFHVTANGTGQTAQVSVLGEMDCPAGHAQTCADLESSGSSQPLRQPEGNTDTTTDTTTTDSTTTDTTTG
jgi:hypothetical protein